MLLMHFKCKTQLEYANYWLSTSKIKKTFLSMVVAAVAVHLEKCSVWITSLIFAELLEFFVYIFSLFSFCCAHRCTIARLYFVTMLAICSGSFTHFVCCFNYFISNLNELK